MEWKVGTRGEVPQTPKRKAKYAERQQVTDKMSKGQIAGVQQWNEMIEILQENNLMEKK